MTPVDSGIGALKSFWSHRKHNSTSEICSGNKRRAPGVPLWPSPQHGLKRGERFSMSEASPKVNPMDGTHILRTRPETSDRHGQIYTDPTGVHPVPDAGQYHRRQSCREPPIKKPVTWTGFFRVWWSYAGSNRRPPACHAGAEPAVNTLCCISSSYAPRLVFQSPLCHFKDVG